MNNERLFEALAEISDRHILEFMDLKPRKKHKAVRISMISAISAACLLLTVTAAPLGKFIRNQGWDFSVHVPMTAAPPNNMTDMPFVRINDTVYLYAGDDVYELPGGYTVIGTVTKTDKEADGYSEGCNFGEEIFGNPGDPDNIYVYTKLFVSEYRYVKFQKSH